MPLLMVRNDITKVQADAIVNPANEDLLEGSGTSKSVYLAAGEELLNNACAQIGHCDLGKAVITDAFHMDAKFIIHAVGPVWNDGYSNEEDMLYSAYTESLKLGVEYKCESIAFPLLSSGNYGYPKDKAMKVAISAISDFLIDHDILVYLVLYDRDSLSISQKLFTSIEEYIDDNYVEDHDQILDGDEEYLASLRRNLEECKESRKRTKEFSLFDTTSNDMTIDISEEALIIPEKASKLESQVHQRSLESLINNLDESFSDMLFRLIDERGLKDSTVYHKANIDRRLFSKIRNNKDYAPSKKTVLAFAIALELSMDETIDLLNKAGFALSRSSKFDIIISFFIETSDYNVFEINEVLFKYEQPLIGADK